MDDKDKKTAKLLAFIRGKEKLKGAPVRSPDYTSPLDQDVMRVKGGGSPLSEPVTRIKNATEHINTKEKIPLGKMSELLKSPAGKKLLGVLPMAGTAAGLAYGDPSMAAEEAAGDIPAIGQIYEALKSEPAGQSSGDERIGLAEDRARKDYKQSPAGLDRMNKLKSLMENRSPAAEASRAPMDPSRIKALTGVDLQQEVDDAQLEEDTQGDPSVDPNSPNSERNLRLRKLFQGQLK